MTMAEESRFGAPETTQVVDVPAQSSTPPPSRKRVRLRDCRDARRLLAATFTAFIRDEIDARQANCRTFMLATFSRIVADAELEARIAKLEAASREPQS